MASSRKLVHRANYGKYRFMCKKCDPSRLSLEIGCWWSKGKHKQQFAGYYEIHKIPLSILEAKIKWLAEDLVDGVPNMVKWHELALDYLFAELGRRANRRPNDPQ